MSSPLLASVDGQISPTDEARIPPGDDGLLRGDGVFEVIRLYAGRPFALGEHLDRLERSAAAIELPVEREALEGEIEALLEEFGDGEGQLRLVVTRGGRRLAFTEALPEHSATVSLASVAYAPTIILTGVKSLSYGANMQATRLAQARGRRGGAAGAPRRGRPGGTDLDHLLGPPGASSARPRWTPASSPRSPAPGSSASWT